MEKQLILSVIEEKMAIELTAEEREDILRFPTKNIHAFLAFCNGLEEEDAGRFEAARGFYEKAFRLDPHFGLIQQKIDAAESMSLAGGSTEDALTAAEQIESTSQDLVLDRLENLGNNLGTNFVPGQDGREPAEEVIQELAEPPDPPREGK